MQPIGKKLVTAMNWQQEPIGKKLALEFFIKNIYATPLVYISSFFIHFLCPTTTSAVSPQKVSFNFSIFYALRQHQQCPLKRLALIYHLLIN